MCELREIIRQTVKNNNKEIQDSGVPNFRTSEDQVGTWVSFLVTEGYKKAIVLIMFLFDKKSLNAPEFVLFYFTLSSLSFKILTYW